jgi:hypothetical protein
MGHDGLLRKEMFVGTMQKIVAPPTPRTDGWARLSQALSAEQARKFSRPGPRPFSGACAPGVALPGCSPARLVPIYPQLDTEPCVAR